MSASTPDWDALYEMAAPQQGLFTAQQAKGAGFSRQLLVHHTKAGRITRLRRGIYRLVHFPPGEHEELVRLWLWSDQAGVFSHQTALALHELSDALPHQVHLTLPSSWRSRRFRVPEGVVLHHADVDSHERSWMGAIPITSAPRTLNDLAREGISPEILRQGAKEAVARGLAKRGELAPVEEALAPFGGLG